MSGENKKIDDKNKEIKNVEILEEIRNLKKDLFNIVNQRLENFKSELLQIIDTRIKLIQDNIQKYIDLLSNKVNQHNEILQQHEKRLNEHDEILDDVTKQLLNSAHKKTFKWIKIYAVIYTIVNIILTTIALFILR